MASNIYTPMRYSDFGSSFVYYRKIDEQKIISDPFPLRRFPLLVWSNRKFKTQRQSPPPPTAERIKREKGSRFFLTFFLFKRSFLPLCSVIASNLLPLVVTLLRAHLHVNELLRISHRLGRSLTFLSLCFPTFVFPFFFCAVPSFAVVNQCTQSHISMRINELTYQTVIGYTKSTARQQDLLDYCITYWN